MKVSWVGYARSDSDTGSFVRKRPCPHIRIFVYGPADALAEGECSDGSLPRLRLSRPLLAAGERMGVPRSSERASISTFEHDRGQTGAGQRG